MRDPALRTTLANSSERTHLAILPRVCGHRCLRFRSCVRPSNQSRASARCSLGLRVRSASHIYVAVDSWRGASRPARRVQADLGEGHEPACHLRPQHVCLHLAHSSMYGTTCPYLPFGCRPSRQCVVSMRRTSRPFLTYTAPPARRGRRIHAVRELWQGNRPARTKMPLCWQNAREMRSRVPCRGKIPPRCVPGRPSVAIFSPHASPRGLRTGKSPLRGKIRTPCIRKRAGFGKICAPCIRKALQTAVWEYTARRSCHEGATFAAQAPRIMHGARILPSSDA